MYNLPRHERPSLPSCHGLRRASPSMAPTAQARNLRRLTVLGRALPTMALSTLASTPRRVTVSGRAPSISTSTRLVFADYSADHTRTDPATLGFRAWSGDYSTDDTGITPPTRPKSPQIFACHHAAMAQNAEDYVSGCCTRKAHGHPQAACQRKSKFADLEECLPLLELFASP